MTVEQPIPVPSDVGEQKKHRTGYDRGGMLRLKWFSNRLYSDWYQKKTNIINVRFHNIRNKGLHRHRRGGVPRVPGVQAGARHGSGEHIRGHDSPVPVVETSRSAANDAP